MCEREFLAQPDSNVTLGGACECGVWSECICNRFYICVCEMEFLSRVHPAERSVYSQSTIGKNSYHGYVWTHAVEVVVSFG